MSYIAVDYLTNANAPVGKWACAPTSSHAPFDDVPSGDITKGKDLCGQCVSYVKQVCPLLPATGLWKKGLAVKNNPRIVAGTVIATFNTAGNYEGHAAIYVSQNPSGVNVYDQFIAGKTPQAVGPRMLRWGAQLDVNNGDKFYVVE